MGVLLFILFVVLDYLIWKHGARRNLVRSMHRQVTDYWERHGRAYDRDTHYRGMAARQEDHSLVYLIETPGGYWYAHVFALRGNWGWPTATLTRVVHLPRVPLQFARPGED